MEHSKKHNVDRRSAKRKRAKFTMRYHIEGRSDIAKSIGATVDISAKGIAFESSDTILIGMRIDAEFDVPSFSVPVKINGHVVRIEEIEKIFQNVGKIIFFNISGGEPFLRDDLPEIVRLACQHLKPAIIHIPTNAIASRRIKVLTLECLKIINEFNSSIPLTVKPSIDGVQELHDEIRGVRGNFKQLEKTISHLKEVETEYPNFHLELGTVISNFNINHLSEIEDYVHSLGIQSYRNEIAEQRTEFFNLEDTITPDAKNSRYIKIY